MSLVYYFLGHIVLSNEIIILSLIIDSIKFQTGLPCDVEDEGRYKKTSHCATRR